MTTDDIQKDIIAEMQRHEGLKRDRHAALGIVLAFLGLVVAVVGGLYWLFVHSQPPELIVIAPREDAKIVPEQAPAQEALRILNLNNPEATAQAEAQDEAVQVDAPEPEATRAVPAQNDPTAPQEDDETRLERLQQKILAGLKMPETPPESAPDTAKSKP